MSIDIEFTEEDLTDEEMYEDYQAKTTDGEKDKDEDEGEDEDEDETLDLQATEVDLSRGFCFNCSRSDLIFETSLIFLLFFGLKSHNLQISHPSQSQIQGGLSTHHLKFLDESYDTNGVLSSLPYCT